MTRLILILLVLLAIACAVHARRRPPSMSFEDPKVVALIEAARRGNGKAVAKMAAAGVDLDARGKYGMTPVLWAVVERDPKALRTLLEAGANPDLADEEGHVPLEWAVQYPDPVIMELLLAHGADPDAKDHNGHPVTFDAVDRDHWEHLDKLIAAGADMEATSRDGMTLLLYLAIFNQFEKVAEFLQRGANYSHENVRGAGLPYYVQERLIDPKSENAMWRDRVKTMLEERGVVFPVPRPWESDRRRKEAPAPVVPPPSNAPSDVFSDSQLLALVEAARRGDAQTMRDLVESGVSPDAKGRSGITPVLWATAEQDFEALQLLLQAGADPNLADDEGRIPLELAMHQGQEFLRLLLRHGANPSARTHRLEPVLILAAERQAWSHVYLLLEEGADLEVANGMGETLLLRTANRGDFERVAQLIERGADPLHRDASGRTVAHYVETSLADPESLNGRQKERVKLMLEERGVQFPAVSPTK